MQNCWQILKLPCWILILGLCTLQAQAYKPKEGSINALFGPFVYKTQYKSNGTGAKSPVFADLGMVVNGDISDKGALEIAMFHMQKLFIREQSGSSIGEEAELIHITMGYRRWINSIFSLSMAIYSSYAIGDYRTVHSDFAPGTEIDTSARDTTEYGVDFSLQSELWSKDLLSLVLDTRYSISATPKSNEQANHYGALIGLRYFIQEKQHVERPKN